ncbi:MAG: 5-(carboxyamino)imidazole ribonucleotide mutase [Phycisphaeraceae bacterium]|nr:5-(carboxyamino)imidazole ribonucleotide mutase [Phycisphaeraceae bacterium]MCB9847355.1 5-(carboxyamino)imidazole ribonucleotide mutase [Phycisphaeraceae bacterium]
MPDSDNPLVLVLMGSASDWPVMEHASTTLDDFGVAHQCKALSAHRNPAKVSAVVGGARERGVQVVIAAAGAAAHLAGVCAAHTTLPVLGVPMTSALDGLDSLLSTVQMPGGVPVGTLAIGKAGAVNAALLAVEILALHDQSLHGRLVAYRAKWDERPEDPRRTAG